MNIGIMGAPVNNSNLGCVALTYSLLLVLEKVTRQHSINCTYIIFEWNEDRDKYNTLSRKLNIPTERVKFVKFALLSDPLRVVKHIKTIVRMINEIKNCDCIIDITEGDSFSDIYGKTQFLGRTNIKRLINALHIPLLLGPQTYGPFFNKRLENVAKSAIMKANMVIARDDISCQILKKMGRTEAIVTSDLAFFLPVEDSFKDNTEGIRVGLNVSGLLYGDGKEVQDRKFSLNADYQKCIHGIIESLIGKNNYKIFLIPHVESDDSAHKIIEQRYPNVIRISPFDNPIEAKSFISTMDVFIGARMHAAIAAFTTSVACIPMAYSRKFSGLFHSVGYEYLIDLQKENTQQAIDNTIAFVDKRKFLAKCCDSCKSLSSPYMDKLYLAIDQWILACHKDPDI